MKALEQKADQLDKEVRRLQEENSRQSQSLTTFKVR